jgi:mannose-6-phosphate isomerase-like protein (cupin superfamily)
MKFVFASVAFCALSLSPVMAAAQVHAVTPAVAPVVNPAVDHLTQAQLIGKIQELTAKAQGPTGNASIKLAEYPNHFTMIALRNKSGGAEIHQNFADVFYVVQGSAALVTGGTVPDGKPSGPGEIPAGVPHQILLGQGETFVYFVIKVKEK